MPNAPAIEAPRPRSTSNRLFESYRAFHEQSFVPIFAADDMDSKTLVEACVDAGLKGIEYTQRRWDADWMIPWIRENFPALHVLAGSTLDVDRFAERARRHQPQVRTLAELAAAGVDGFVSLTGWRPENIRKHCRTHLVVPCAMTLGEAFAQVSEGAHFVKLIGTNPRKPDLDFVRVCRFPATFNTIPIMYSGWILPKHVPEIVGAGALVFGTGLEYILRDEVGRVTKKRAAAKIRKYADAARAAREKLWPRTLGGSTGEWLDALPHVHPFVPEG